MKTIDSTKLIGGCFALALLLAPLSSSAADDHWFATWGASPFAFRAFGNIPGPQPVQNQTLREKLRISVGGDKVRIRLSNEIGTKPLKIGSASIALAKGESAIDAGSLHKLTFSGADSIVIPPGAPALSDPIDLKVADLAELAISLYLPEQTAPETLHGGRTAYVSTAGDFTKADALQGAKLGTDMLFLTAVYVSRSDQPAVLVTFGDSITDGTASTPHAYASWPDDLAKLLSTGAKGRRVAVVNEGISGNQVLQDGAGVSALARFDRDVLSQPGLTHIVVLEGINDIGISGLSFGPNAPASPIRTAAELIAGHRQLIARAHARGIKIYGATLTPFAGVQGGYYSPEKDVVRGELNKWIRESKEYDGVIDFDAATRDPAKPDTMLQMYNSGDKLHPGDAGYKHMAEGIDPALFK